jgi:hypothetical protein
MKKLFLAVIAFVLSLSATANNWKEGKSSEFNSVKKEGLQMSPEAFKTAIKNGDMSWSREKITEEDYLQNIADWNNQTGVWKLAGFNGPLTIPQIKFMLVNSEPMLVTVPAQAMKIMGTDPKGGFGWFYNEYEMDVKFLTFKSNNGYLIPMVKMVCLNGVGGYAVAPEVVTVEKVKIRDEVNVRDSVVIKRVTVEDHVTVVDHVTQIDHITQTNSAPCCQPQPIYCQGFSQPVATGFGLNLGLNFTFVKNNQQAAPAPAPPITINISNPITVINTNNNDNDNTNNNNHNPVVLEPEVIVPVTPQGQPVDGNPVVLNPDGTPVDPNPVVINPGGQPVDPNGTVLNPDGTPVDPLKNSSTSNSARMGSQTVNSGSGKFGQQDQTTAKVIPTEQPVATAPQQKSGKFGQTTVTPQSNSGSKISTTQPVQETTATVKSGKFGQSSSQNASVAPTNNQSARVTQPSYNNGSSAKYSQNSYSPQPVYTNRPANVNYGNGSGKFSNNSGSMNNSGARMMNSGSKPGSGKFK